MRPIDKHFSGSFYNDSKEGMGFSGTHLTEVLNLEGSDRTIDIIHLSFIDSTHLHIAGYDYIDTALEMTWRPDALDRKQWMVEGKIYRNQYFTTSMSNIHHWVPFVSSHKDYTTIRIGLMKDGRLIVSEKFTEVRKWLGESTETETNYKYYFLPVKRAPNPAVAGE